jgi:hypothetical protein
VSAPHLTRSDLESLFPEPTLLVEEVAGRLRRHSLTVIRAIKRGELEALHGLGRPYVLTRSAVIAWALGPNDPAHDRAPDDPEKPLGPKPAAAAKPDERHVSSATLERRRAMPAKRRAA